MKTMHQYVQAIIIGFALHIALSCGAASPDNTQVKTRLLVVTGGHDFEKEAFFKLFQTGQFIYQAFEHPQAHELLTSTAADQYDVIVLYDMWQTISDKAKADWLALLKKGKGVVALHHCLGSYQEWPEYRNIIGGKYYLKPEMVDGKEMPASTYQHDVKFSVRVLANHPVTQGVNNFDIQDETYGKFGVSAGVTPLLGTDEPTSGKTIGWAHQYAGSRVVYLALGHDHLAYENPNFKKLLYQSIAWVSKKD